MKNVLILSQLKPDTISAVKAALKYGASGCTVTMLLLQEAQINFSSAAALRNLNCNITQGQKDVLASCREIITNTSGCAIKIHTQYGISAPLIKNIISSFSIELIIIPAAFPTEKHKVYKQCLQLLLNSKCPILHMGRYCREQDFNAAFYIEYNKCPVKAEAVMQVIKNILPVKAITSKKIFSENKDNDIPPQLAEAIIRNNTDLLIETRRPERVNLNKNIKSPADKLGISVLSIPEGAF